MRIIVVILLLAFFVGCDPYRSAQNSWTTTEVAKVEAGEQNFIIHPLPDVLLSHSENEQVVQNLNELSLIDDLAPYTNSQIHRFNQISKITLYCTKNTDQFLALVPTFPKLTELYIAETDATDAGVVSVSKCEKLVGFGITSWGDSLSMKSINELANVHTLQQIDLEIASKPIDLSKLREALPECTIYETTYTK